VSTASHEPETAAAPSETDDEIPEWDRDPTLAQLRPDLDALEQALAVDEAVAPEPEVEIPEKDAVEEEVPEVMPEITLDRRIQAKVDEAEEQIRQENKRRAEAEAEKQKKKEAGVDKRTTAEILVDAGVRDPDPEPAPETSAKEQVSAEPPAPEAPVATQDLHATSDTIHELPVLIDATEPAFEPAKYRKPEPTPAPEPKAKPEPASEINLELEVDQKPAKESVQESPAKPAAEPEPSPEELENARKADAELEQIASNLARAKTIDDCDDKMAETLFGEEFSMMAAQVAANAPPELLEDDAPQEPELSLETEALDEPQKTEESANDEAADPAFAALQDFEGAAAINVELEADSVITGSGDTSASQRLQTVRALNTGSPGASSNTPAAKPDEPKPPAAEPESIEDQFNTSMTQTMKTLTIPPVANDDDDDDGKSKRGFFSRFRR
jgi:hypothetical protein